MTTSSGYLPKRARGMERVLGEGLVKQADLLRKLLDNEHLLPTEREYYENNLEQVGNDLKTLRTRIYDRLASGDEIQ